MKKYSKEELIKSVRIVEVADKLGIPLEDVQTGNFTHRCRCPSPKHNERTGSLFIDSVNNNFYCFGCCASNNVIDFYILAATSDFIGAINYLSELVDPNKIVVADSEKKETNFNDLLKISIGFKKILRKYPEDFDWITSIMEKTDRYVESIDRHDVERVKILQKKLGETFKRRFDKKCGQ